MLTSCVLLEFRIWQGLNASYRCNLALLPLRGNYTEGAECQQSIPEDLKNEEVSNARVVQEGLVDIWGFGMGSSRRSPAFDVTVFFRCEWGSNMSNSMEGGAAAGGEVAPHSHEVRC
jgi:hypothetical protein